MNTTKSNNSYYLIKRGHKKFCGIAATIPLGLSISIYSDELKAHKRVKALASRFRTGFRYSALEEPLSSFEKYYEEGIAGALFDDTMALHFRKYAQHGFQVIRVEIGKDDHEKRALTHDGEWCALDYLADDTVISQVQVFDAKMVEYLDRQPIWGVTDLKNLLSLHDRATKSTFVEHPKNNDRYPGDLIIFSAAQLARDFRRGDEKWEEKWELIPLDKPYHTIVSWIEKGGVVLLNPSSHRALQGRFSLLDNTMIMESYSGLWQFDEKMHASLHAMACLSDRQLDSSQWLRDVKKEGCRYVIFDYDDDSSILATQPGKVTQARLKLKNWRYELLLNNSQLKQVHLLCTEEESKGELERQLTEVLIRSLDNVSSLPDLESGLSFFFLSIQSRDEAAFEIPQIRRFYQSLIKELPGLLYFISDDHDQIRSCILSCIPKADSLASEKEWHSLLIAGISEFTIAAMRCAIKKNREPAAVAAKTFEAFDLEIDADMYEAMLKVAQASNSTEK